MPAVGLRPIPEQLSHLIPIHIHRIVDDYPWANFYTVGRAWKTRQGVWILRSDTDHHRPCPAAVQLPNTNLVLKGSESNRFYQTGKGCTKREKPSSG